MWVAILAKTKSAGDFTATELLKVLQAQREEKIRLGCMYYEQRNEQKEKASGHWDLGLPGV
jgi:hypothetical protein